MSPWWDGYEGQIIVIMDEFYGWIRLAELNRLCDEYPWNAQIKGGFILVNSKQVVFTSNSHPADWYKSDKLIYGPDAPFASFTRCVDHWIHFCAPRTHVTYMSYDDFFYYVNCFERGSI